MNTATSERIGRSGVLRSVLLVAISAIAIGLGGCGLGNESTSGTTSSAAIPFNPGPFSDALGENGHIGGSIDRIVRFDNSSTAWIAYNVGSSLLTTAPGNGDVSAPRYRLDLAGVIEDIKLVTVEGKRIALVAMSRSGVAAVDLTNPAAPSLIASAPVAIAQTVPMTVDGGGNDYPDVQIFGPGEIMATATDGTSVWLADERFGVHKLALATLLNPASRLADGSLPIESQVFTVSVPEEDVFWGGPTYMRLYEGKLFVTRGVVGLSIYDPATLERVGGYNLYLDTSMKEDRFYGADVRTEVQSDAGGPFLDAESGMPDYRQAQFELTSVLRDGASAPTPWFDLARGGQYFYRALSLDIAQFGERTIAYIAYNNAGLVAADITGFDAATTQSQLTRHYLAYLPAVKHAQAEDQHTSQDDGGGDGVSACPGGKTGAPPAGLKPRGGGGTPGSVAVLGRVGGAGG